MKGISWVLGVTLWAIGSIAPRAAEDTLTAIGQRLAKHTVLCGEFTQSKRLKALTRPLDSSGRLAFIAGQGVLWEVLEPFPARVVIKNNALIKWDDDGSVRRVEFSHSPLFNALSRVFQAVFSGDVEALRTSFRITPEQTPSGWHLILKPLDSRLSAIVESVRVSGNRFIDELEIAERRGDQTEIRFEKMASDTCQLSAAEKQYLAQ